MEIRHVTKGREVSLVIEGSPDKVLPLKVRVDGITVAYFDVAMVWDRLMETLTNLRNPKDYLGIERRAYVASNIWRLTNEWVERQEEEDDREPITRTNKGSTETSD